MVFSPERNWYSGQKYYSGIYTNLFSMEPQKFSKKELLSLIVHELKSPIGIIKWHTEMLLSGDYGPTTEEQRTIFREMEKENTRIFRLIREFLQISLVPESGVSLDMSEIVIGDVLHDVLSELHENIAQEGHSIIDTQSNLAMMADRHILRLIFHTILSNAIKYTPKNGTITIDIRKNEQEYIISVANNGESIAPDEQLRIYEQNSRTDHARALDPEGTGLGLYLMKSIVEETSGRTWFTSIPGEDTIFYVAYPLTGMHKKKEQKPPHL